MSDKTCKELVKSEYLKRMSDLRKLWELWKSDSEASDPDLGNFNEYGLCLDYVAPGTFNGQRRGYLRYQISWGGPSDEFRFYMTKGFNLDRVEYWYMDWFDGAKRNIRAGRDFDTLKEIFEDFRECGTVEAEYNKAVEA